MTRHVYPPLRSTIHVYQLGEEDRIYEAVTDDDTEWSGVKAKQLSGPQLAILVSEYRFKFWGGSGGPPEHPTRSHAVRYTPLGAKDPQPMTKIRGTRADVEIFKKYGKPGEIGYWIPRTGIVTDEP